jgi:transposase-like protein
MSTKTKINDDMSIQALAQQLLDNSKENGISLTGNDGLLTRLTKTVLQTALESEMNEHLGYLPNDRANRNTDNFRNGSSSKTVKSEIGDIELDIPRDREGSFEPTIIPKHQRKISGFEDQVMELYSSGMSTRSIVDYLKNIYGSNVSPDLVSKVTDAVLDEMEQWKTRPLETIYPVLFIDAIVLKVRDGSVVNKPVYVAYAIDMEGKRDVLSLWTSPTSTDGSKSGEGARYWTSMLSELKNRGVDDILIVCCDGLKGLPDSIATVFPQATVQLCVVHMIRNSLKHVPHSKKKQVASDLKKIYTSVNESQARRHFDDFKNKYEKNYSYAVKTWENRWSDFVPFLDFPEEVRKVIYTTNAIESLNSRFRRATKTRGSLPSEQSALKLLYLSVIRKDKTYNIKKQVFNWKSILNVLYNIYGDRLEEK